MRFLKPLAAQIAPNERSRRVAEVEEQTDGTSYEMRRYIAGLKSRLAKRGDATKVTVSGLPIKGEKSNPDRKVTIWIPRKEWDAAEGIPIRRSVTTAEVKYDFGADDVDTAKGGPEVCALWILRDRVYLALDPDLDSLDVLALVNQESNTRRLALEKAHALQAMTEQLDKPRMRERLPQEVRIEVWQRDSGRCVECGSQENLEFDHIIPFAMGGSSTARNLQLLCGDCNRRKGMTLG